MDLTTLVILLISLGAVILAALIAVFNRQRDSTNKKKTKEHVSRPLVHNSEDMSSFMGRHLSAIPIAIVVVVFLAMLAKCGNT